MIPPWCQVREGGAQCEGRGGSDTTLVPGEGGRCWCSPDIVVVPPLKLLYDELGVKEDKATEDQEAKPQLDLSNAVGREEVVW